MSQMEVQAGSGTCSEQLARFVLGLRYEDIPPQVMAKVRLLVLDAVGLALASFQEDFGLVVREVAAELGRSGVSPVAGSGERYHAAIAALVNGTLVHGLDFDDSHTGSLIHTTSTIVPAAFAVAEETGAGGREVLAAITGATEVLCRIGLVQPNEFHRRGFHPTSACGAFGAAYVAARLYGLTPEQTVNAVGIVGSQAAGIRESYLGDGTWTKRMHPGWAAHSAIAAVRLARRGFTGPATVFEGRFGFFNTHLGPDNYDTAVLTRDLGDDWEIMRISFKPYPCGVVSHAFIDCALSLRQQPGFRLEDVESVTAIIAEKAVPTMCEPVESKLRPRSGYHAKFSLPFIVASALRDGAVTIGTFTDERVQDPELLALTARVGYVHDPDSPYPRTYPGGLRTRFRDGRVMEHYEPYQLGSLQRPMSEGALVDKFLANATRFLPRGWAEATADRLVALDRQDSVRGLLAPES